MSKLKFEKPALVALASLVFSSKIQPRAALNPEAVKDYTDLCTEAKAKGADFPLPALRAVKRGDELLVIRGFHRGSAARKAEYTEVPVEIAESADITERELFALAVVDNKEHGVRLSNADLHHNLTRALKFPEYTELSNPALADIIGSSEFFVRKNRPVAKAPETRKTKKGKEIKTTGIGKKGGRKKPAKKGKPGEESLDPELEAKKGKGGKGGESGINEAAQRHLNRICTLVGTLDGFKSSAFRESVEKGTLPLTAADLKVWAETSDSRVKQIAPLVIGQQWKPAKVVKFIDAEVDSTTRVDHLINLALVGGGVVKRNGKADEFGEVISDSKDYVAIVYDRKKFVVAIAPIDK